MPNKKEPTWPITKRADDLNNDYQAKNLKDYWVTKPNDKKK